MLAIGITIAIGIYAAQPWGDNYAFQNILDYLTLFIVLGWEISPYLYLIWAIRLNKIPERFPQGIFIVLLFVCFGGVALLLDTVFIQNDAQGGLVFLFLPFYQWVILGIFTLVKHFIANRYAT